MCIFFLQILIKVEPYWNVNYEPYQEDKLTILIKVEPYWNVNSLFNILSTNTLDD